MANPADDGILERQATSPMATACLIVAFFAVLGAILLGVIEIGELRAGIGASGAQRTLQGHLKDLNGRADDAIENNDKLAAELRAQLMGEQVGTDDTEEPEETGSEATEGGLSEEPGDDEPESDEEE